MNAGCAGMTGEDRGLIGDLPDGIDVGRGGNFAMGAGLGAGIACAGVTT